MAALSTQEMSSGYRTALALALLAILVLYFPVISWMWRDWWLAPGPRYYSHGLLIVFISLFLILRGRSACVQAPGKLYGLAVLASGLALAASGWVIRALWVSALSLPLVLLGILGLFLGARALRRLIFPVLFLAMAVPLPIMGIIGDWLKDIVGQAAIDIARALGTQFTVDRVFFSYVDPMLSSPRPVLAVLFPDGTTYYVVALCSGLNLVLAWYAILLPLLYLTHTAWLRLGIFLLSIPLVGFVVKTLLLAMAFVVTPVGGEDLANRMYHEWLGIPAFLGFLVLLVIPLMATRKRKEMPVWQDLLIE